LNNKGKTTVADAGDYYYHDAKAVESGYADYGYEVYDTYEVTNVNA
jgi:hypothetical protein